ncbi:MAG: hypothetical protein KJ799_00010 [Bacteroidetes bacterium]|nr:hypothetical protein [Bacteroidota bacterium]
MKNIILLFLLTAIFCSCNSSSNETEPKKSKTEVDYEIADMFLEYDAEKIGLLSIIKNVPHEKANSVLRDYLAKTLGSALLTMESPDYIVKVVDTIAQKNNLSRKLTASIIFSYQYEMITRDEIIEESIDEMEDYEPEQY